MQKAIVTGGAGFIGSHLCDALVARGFEVVAIDNLSTGKRENVPAGVRLVEGSFLDSELLAREFDGATFVFHEGAVPSVPKSLRDPLTSHEANATGTLKVLLAARDAGVSRVVCASSSSVYGDTPTLPKREDMPVDPLSPYALQKFDTERYAMQFYTLFGLETVALRYFNVYGPRQDPSSEYAAVIPRFITMMKKGETPTIFGDGTTSRDFTYVSDVVEANILAATTPGAAGEVFNIAGGRQISLNDLVEQINTILGTGIKAAYEPFRKGDILHSLADVSKAKKILGFEPKMSFTDGLRETAGALL